MLQRLMFLFAIAGLVAVTADFACLKDVCADLKQAEFRTMEDLQANRIDSLEAALSRSNLALPGDKLTELRQRGHLFGVLKLDRPVKHPDGTVELPTGWLPELPEGHPWAGKLTPADDAFYSFFEERIVKAKLFDPTNAEHMSWAQAYLAKQQTKSPEFMGWTYASRTSCDKLKYDAAGTKPPPDAGIVVPGS
jgi:hypothetical protein